MTPLEKAIIDDIRQIAINEPSRLLEYIDLEKLKICRQREMGKTLAQIANAMQMPKSTVRNKCKVC